jgi:hypothetical protein
LSSRGRLFGVDAADLVIRVNNNDKVTRIGP